MDVSLRMGAGRPSRSSGHEGDGTVRGMGKQLAGSESKATDLLSRLTNPDSRRGFRATLGAGTGGGLVLLTTRDPARTDKHDWDDRSDDDWDHEDDYDDEWDD